MAVKKKFGDRNIVNPELDKKTRTELEEWAAENKRSARSEAAVLIREALDTRATTRTRHE